MFMDNQLSFNGGWATANAQAVTTTADSANVWDITGAGVGNAPAMINGFPQLNTHIGADYGAAGDGPAVPWVVVTVVVAPTSSSNTLTIQIEGAPDSGTYTEGTYHVYGQTGAIPGSALLAGSIILFPLPPRMPGTALPRFYKLHYVASATLTPMTVLAGVTINPTSWLSVAPQIDSNFIAVGA